MARRWRDGGCCGGRLKTGDIVHLQAQQMTQAMRQENRRKAALQSLLRVRFDDVVGRQQFGDQQVRLQVQIAPVQARTHGCAQGLL